MVSQEVYDGIMSALRIVKKLDMGEVISIHPGSVEHKALMWAIVKLMDDNLFDHSPLSGKDLERAQEVIKNLRLDKGI